MMRTRVKMCGFTRAEDVDAAVALGADALGFVFYPPSPRNVSLEQAVELMARVPAFVTTVALFVDPDAEFVQQVIEQAQVDLLQFHGNESQEFCTQFKRPWIKALRAKSKIELEQQVTEYNLARGILLDAYVQGVPGGTGQSFDWSMIPQTDLPIILAGGLDAENVHLAIEQVKPWAVDVSGGIEAEKGIKSAAKMQRFVEHVLRGGHV